MLITYRCTIRTFFHNGLREPGDIVVCDPEDVEMKGNPCFVPEKNEQKHIESEEKKAEPAPEPEVKALSKAEAQPKKGTEK